MTKTHCDICDRAIVDEDHLYLEIAKGLDGSTYRNKMDDVAVCLTCIETSPALKKLWDLVNDEDHEPSDDPIVLDPDVTE